MRHATLTLLVLLAACSTRPVPPAEPETPEAALCRAETRDFPERRRLMAQRTENNAPQVDGLIADAQLRAFRDCMRRRGISEGDGVERVRR